MTTAERAELSFTIPSYVNPPIETLTAKSELEQKSKQRVTFLDIFLLNIENIVYFQCQFNPNGALTTLAISQIVFYCFLPQKCQVV